MKVFGKKSLLIFDLDGLLCNTEDVYLEGWKQGLDQIGLSIDRCQLSTLSGQSPRAIDAFFINKD
ncbi:HAD hydrolase-like protein [Streptococcus sp. DD13]|uniref:HAD hydrolase-like protein n=1 Tax=Streptococcus sp. DD13 TaxID=1777881 RepID=UPI000799F575|nr:HAD hydrolase-like protein [Streptococcus sp. DD13]KXT79005.1 hypothetical protein STRDD13_00261 [Streptococcus sp. DD13]